MPADFAVTELWQVLAGKLPGRTSKDQITMFDSVGFALEDSSALRFLQSSASAQGLTQPLDLIPALDDPKNLYQLIQPKPLIHTATERSAATVLA
jgi:ornithine cyclodeaminase